jgi:hypothetical protein
MGPIKARRTACASFPWWNNLKLKEGRSWVKGGVVVVWGCIGKIHQRGAGVNIAVCHGDRLPDVTVQKQNHN